MYLNVLDVAYLVSIEDGEENNDRPEIKLFTFFDFSQFPITA